MSASSSSVLECLKGEQLSAVTFVQDYLQLHFDGPCLNGYVWPSIEVGNSKCQFNEPGYRDKLCTLIAKKVLDATASEDEFLRIEFIDGSRIEFSLSPSDREGPEAVMLQDAERKNWNVW